MNLLSSSILSAQKNNALLDIINAFVLVMPNYSLKGEASVFCACPKPSSKPYPHGQKYDGRLLAV